MPVFRNGAKDAKAVTPSDADDLKAMFGDRYVVTVGLMVSVAGDVEMVFADASDSVVIALEAGVYPFFVKHILASGTTASGIVALF